MSKELHVSAHKSHLQAYKYGSIQVRRTVTCISLCVTDDLLYWFILTTHGDVPHEGSMIRCFLHGRSCVVPVLEVLTYDVWFVVIA